ncbi:MAG: diaminopropionate ammonia-lyase [Lachnospiraceae bacterium]|nr:diaminopropionate ammonia-lyase [Lachnospiraceae bacterium]
MKEIRWIKNNMPKTECPELDIMSEANVAKARSFHESFPEYSKTPLAKLNHLAEHLGLGGLYVKDESYRFGLNAFKVLGGSYAIARYIAKKLGKDISEVPYHVLTSEKLREEFGQAAFYVATDGNHGRGVAWAANRLHQKCIVHMPKGSTENRRMNIAKENAQVTIEELNYDDCVRLANEEANRCENGIMVQDTSWEGYVEIPTWISQGYGTLSAEAKEQLEAYGVKRPTHIFTQAGVGSFASSVHGYFVNQYPDNPPRFIVVESLVAACLYRGALAGDGKPRCVGGSMQTIQAGLACGEPNLQSWEILRSYTDVFAACPDWVTEKGMRILAAPLKGDPQVTSGESGAVPLGLLYTIMTDPAYADLKAELGLDETSQVLCFSTEGNTDPDRYREIIWDGRDVIMDDYFTDFE